MSPARAFIAAAVVVIVLVWGVWRAGPSSSDPLESVPPKVDEPLAASTVPEAMPVTSSSNGQVDPRFLIDPDADPLAGLVGEGLNAPGGSATRDLQITSEILDAWQTNFPGQGNPVGLNREITRSLTGANRLRVELIPADHPAINLAGELCDRWGTPLSFHQISGSHMELRSAGPDRRLYSEDDLLWNEAEPF